FTATPVDGEELALVWHAPRPNANAEPALPALWGCGRPAPCTGDRPPPVPKPRHAAAARFESLALPCQGVDKCARCRSSSRQGVIEHLSRFPPSERRANPCSTVAHDPDLSELQLPLSGERYRHSR